MVGKKSFFFHYTTLSLCLMPFAVMASTNSASVPLSYTLNPYIGRLLMTGTITKEGIAGVDGMLPIYGNRNGFLFADAMGDYATGSTWMVSPGTGYRQIVDNQIVGLNFFGDYQRTNLGQNFWDLSPGIEWITPRWDAHANLYFPTTKSKKMGAPVFASTLGNNNYVGFEEGTHNQYDLLEAPYAMIGNGADTEIGYSLPSRKNLRSRIYLGGYYYQPPSSVSTITGVTMGFEKPLSKYISVAFRNSYDRVSNDTVAVSFSLTFGGSSNHFSNDVSARLLDPIQRHIGIIGTGAGTYAQKAYKSDGMSLQYDNVYFIAPDDNALQNHNIIGLADNADIGTYGDPAILNQATLDAIHAQSPNARIYIQGGSNAIYHVDSTTATHTGAQGLWVYGGQDFYGRTANYTAPAASNELPQISVDGGNSYAGFITQGGENTFSNLSIASSSGANSPLASGIVSNDDGGDETVNIDNTVISDMYYGVLATNNANGLLTINADNSEFNHNVVQGMNITGGNGPGPETGSVVVNATDSQFNNNGVVNGGGVVSAAGLSVVNGSSTSGSMIVNIANSQFNGNGVANGGFTGVLTTPSAGVIVQNYSDIGGVIKMNISGSQFNGNGVANAGGIVDGPAAGIYAQNIGVGGPPGSGITINATQSEFNGNGVANGIGSAVTGPSAGLIALNDVGSVGPMTISATYSQFNGNGLANNGGVQGGITAGLYVNNQAAGEALSVTSLLGSTFDNNNGYGIYGVADAGAGSTSIDYSGAYFSGVLQTNNTNQAPGDHINWIS